MANIIKIKRGSGAPTSANLQDGELGFDKTNNALYIGTGTSVLRLAPFSFTFASTGDTTTPIYINNSGNFVACTPYSSASVSHANTASYLSASNYGVGNSSKPVYFVNGLPSAISGNIGTVSQPIYLNGGVITATTSTIGTVSKPVYLNAGKITAITSTVGTVSKPVYLNAGALTAITSTVGTVSKPVYLNAGAITAITSTIGSVSKPVYLNAGAITALTSTVGSVSQPVYLNAGAITALTSTIGGTNQPVYLNAGAITAASSYVDFVVEQGEAASASGGSATLTWTYRKWDSGVAECWSKSSWSVTSFTLWSNGVYEGSPRPWWNFPSGLFNAIPVLQALHCTDGGTWFQDVITDGGTKTTSAANTCAFCALRPNNYAPVPITTHLYAKGTWK